MSLDPDIRLLIDWNYEGIIAQLCQCQPLTLFQLCLLAHPDNVEYLERKLEISVTGRVSEVYRNYPAHHYTVKCEEYHGKHDTCAKLAFQDGNLEAHLFYKTGPVTKLDIQIAASRGHFNMVDSVFDRGDYEHIEHAMIAAAFYGYNPDKLYKYIELAKLKNYFIRDKLHETAYSNALRGGHIKLAEDLDVKFKIRGETGLAHILHNTLPRAPICTLEYMLPDFSEDGEIAEIFTAGILAHGTDESHAWLLAQGFKYLKDDLDNVITSGNLEALRTYETRFKDVDVSKQYGSFLYWNLERDHGEVKTVEYILDKYSDKQMSPSMWTHLLMSAIQAYSVTLFELVADRCPNLADLVSSYKRSFFVDKLKLVAYLESKGVPIETAEEEQARLGVA